MTRDEALELLRRGGDDAVAIWNSWRGITWVRGHPQYAKDGPLLPRLNDANLAGVDLRGIDLTDADLSWTDLRGAKLQGSSFFGARLAYTDLREADFTNCQLGNANFLWTKLHKANLAGCSLRKTVFCCDLSAAHGLNNLTYFGSSIMSIECIRYFTKEFPQRLLMGCGFTDDEIAFLRSVAPLPAEYHSCFISHSSADSEFGERLYRDLQTRGVRAWYAPHDLPIGARLRVDLDEAIKSHQKLLLILSMHSVFSPWVEKEVEAAFEQERIQGLPVLFPIRVDDAVMTIQSGWAADVRRSRNVGDFKNWKEAGSYEASFSRLLRDLKCVSS